MWTGNKDSFVSFPSHKIIVNPKKKKFKIHFSPNEFRVLDVTVSLKHGRLRTTPFSKATDSHFYLNTSSCRPSNVLKNVPKEQFI